MTAKETYGVMGFVDEKGDQNIHYPISQAELITYDNKKSGLDAEDAQAAIDALAGHTEDTTKHITAAERTAWNAKTSNTGDVTGPAASTDAGLAAFSGTTGKALKKAESKGSATQGVYLDTNGVPQPMTYSVNKTVPSDAKFTDTTYNNATQSAGGLMSNTDKSKLDGIASGAMANSASSTTPKANGTAVAETEAAYARGDHVHPTDTSRAAASHNHAAGDINSGILPATRGGTGNATGHVHAGQKYGTKLVAGRRRRG